MQLKLVCTEKFAHHCLNIKIQNGSLLSANVSGLQTENQLLYQVNYTKLKPLFALEHFCKSITNIKVL